MRVLFAIGMLATLITSSCTTTDELPPTVTEAGVIDGAEVGDGALFDTMTPGPAASCVQFLQCVAAVAAAELEAQEAAYGAGSICWTGDGDASSNCAQECSGALATLLENHPLEEACGGCDPAKDSSCSIIGVPCVDENECETDRCLKSLDNPQVLFDGGYCTQVCVIAQANACPDGSSCGALANEQGLFVNKPYCFRLCDAKADCRSGYECKRIPIDDQGSLGEKVCQPGLK
ncbi:MAG: hypothetical protein JRH20_17205 [Deltaproteobacteria bacterium]|nr:hypothetical protein [Deltaproteobacteria bacterium]